MSIINCRKKPVIVSAIQWNGTNLQDCKNFCGDCLHIDYPALDDSIIILTIDTLEGKMNVSMNDFIIQGVDKEFYPCKESIFYKTYDIL